MLWKKKNPPNSQIHAQASTISASFCPALQWTLTGIENFASALITSQNYLIPSRDFSPNLKQDLSGLSGFFRQLRSKSCFKMSGLSGFWTVLFKKTAKKPRTIWTVLSGLSKKTAQKPLKSYIFSSGYFARVFESRSHCFWSRHRKKYCLIWEWCDITSHRHVTIPRRLSAKGEVKKRIFTRKGWK